jgi:hypothetical protein
VDYAKSLGLDGFDTVEQAKIGVEAQLAHHAESSSASSRVFPSDHYYQQRPLSLESAPTRSEKTIYVAQNRLANTLDSKSTDTSVFTMAQAGEGLNCDVEELQTRTGIIELNYETLGQQYRIPAKFVPIARSVCGAAGSSTDYQLLSREDIERYKREVDDDNNYYLFRQSLKAGRKIRLLSVDAQERFIGIIESDSGITIEKGDDDFYYATTTSDRVLEYAVGASKQKITIETLPQNDPIRKLIEHYKDPGQGYHDNEAHSEFHLPQIEHIRRDDPSISQEEVHNIWLEMVFNSRAGACRHRVAAVAHKLMQENVDFGNFRIIGINNDHVILEVRESDGRPWIKVDLGGASAQEAITSEVYSGEALQTGIIGKKSLSQTISSLVTTSKEMVAGEKIVDAIKYEEQSSVGLIGEKEVERKIETSTTTPTTSPQPRVVSMIDSILEKSTRPQIIHDRDELSQHIDNLECQKILIKTDGIDHHANFFLRQAKMAGRKVFYIDSPDKIGLDHKTIFIDEGGAPVIRDDGLFGDFLNLTKRAALPPASSSIAGLSSPLILINWDKFSSKERLQLNSLLDKTRTICGREIPTSIQIIGLTSETQRDQSFLSRHHTFLESTIDLTARPDDDMTIDDDQQAIIDLQGFPNWQQAVFGIKATL